MKRILLLLVLVGCTTATKPSNMPLNGIAKVLSTGYNSVSLEYQDYQLVDYNLCEGATNPTFPGIVVDISFTWNAHDRCFLIKDVYRQPDLEK